MFLQGKRISLKNKSVKDSFVTVSGITHGARIHTYSTTLHMYPGLYGVTVKASS